MHILIKSIRIAEHVIMNACVSAIQLDNSVHIHRT